MPTGQAALRLRERSWHISVERVDLQGFFEGHGRVVR